MELKPTLLLATTLFLISAPEPDSRTIAEATANFIVPTDERALQAADSPLGNSGTGSSADDEAGLAPTTPGAHEKASDAPC